MADSADEAIYEFDDGGKLISMTGSRTIDENFVDPKGLAVEPSTGNLLITGDQGGTSGLHEVATNGEYVSGVDLLELTGYPDPESVSLDPETGTVYVAFASRGRIGVFEMQLGPEQTSSGR